MARVEDVGFASWGSSGQVGAEEDEIVTLGRWVGGYVMSKYCLWRHACWGGFFALSFHLLRMTNMVWKAGIRVMRVASLERRCYIKGGSLAML